MSKIKEDHIALVIDVKTAEAQQQMRQLERATADLRKEMKTRQNAMLELEAAGKKETDEYRRIQGEMQAYNAQIKENERQLRGMRSGMDITAMTMTQLRKHARELQTELNNTSKATNPKEYEQLASQLRNVNGRMAELRADASRLSSTTGEQTSGITSKFNSMFSSISANWTKAIGMIGAGVAALSTVIEGAKWWYNYNSEIEEAQRLTREFTGLAGDELVSVRSRIQAISDTFGKDYKDVLGSVDALMAQYGISAQEAMKVVEDGFTAGADLGGNMLSMINQYAPAFNDAGIGASELVAIIAQTRSGIFSEGGMALIQMASKKIREMERTTATSLDAIGINSKKLQSELRSGAKGTFDAVREISEALKKMPKDSQEVGNVLKDVFGRQGASGGLKMIESLADMTTKMEDVKTVTGEFGELQQEEINAQAGLNEKMSKFFGIGDKGFEEITMKAKVFALNALSSIIDYTVKIINYFINLYNESTAFRAEIETLKFHFKLLWDGVKLGFNIVIDGFKAMGRMAKAWGTVLEGVLTLDTDKITNGVGALFNAYKDSFTEFVDDAKKFGKSTAKNYAEAFNNTIKGNKVKPITLEMNVKKKGAVDASSTATAVTTANGGSGGGKGKQKGKKEKAFNPDDIATKDFSNDRKDDIAEVKRDYQQQLNALDESLAKRRLSQEQYSSFILALKEGQARQLLAIEKNYLERAEAMTFKDGQKKAELIKGQNDNVNTAEQQHFTSMLAISKQYNDALKQLQDQGMTDEQKREADHALQLSSLEAFYKARLAQARQYGEDDAALTEAYERAKAEIIRKYEQQAEEERYQTRMRAGLVSQKEIFERELAQLKEKLAAEGATEEEQQRAAANMTQQFEEDRLRIRQQYGIATQQELYDAEMAQLKQHLDAEMISQEEYEQAVAQMKMDKWKQSFDYYSNLFGTAIKGLQDAEMANVDAKYDAEIEAAQGNADQVEKLEKEKANEKLKIQKKYADVNFAIQASQIIVNTAVSVMKAFSELGPIGGAIAGALMSVAGTAQLAVANAERQKVKKMTLQGASAGSSATGARVATGLEDGGNIDVEREQDGKRFKAKFEPHRRGYVDRPTVLVGEGPAGHSKEWVASNAAMENPTVAPLIDVIDKAQRTGDIRTLDLRKVMMQRGLAGGGFVSPSAGNATQHPTTPVPSAAAPAKGVDDELLALLRDLRQNGIPSFVALDEIEARQKIQQQYRKIAQKQ
jgi:hypothetical protein